MPSTGRKEHEDINHLRDSSDESDDDRVLPTSQQAGRHGEASGTDELKGRGRTRRYDRQAEHQ